MDLYRELILEHAKRPRHAGLREPYAAQIHHVNSTCGDEVTLRVDVAEGGRVRDVSYDAIGCSISVASASVLTEEVIGRDVADVAATYDAMRTMLTSRGTDPGDEGRLGDGVALAGVSRYPARVKCALLPWAALVDALARTGHDITHPPAALSAVGAPDSSNTADDDKEQS